MFLVEDFGIWEFLIFWVYLYAYPLIIFVIFPQKKKNCYLKAVDKLTSWAVHFDSEFTELQLMFLSTDKFEDVSPFLYGVYELKFSFCFTWAKSASHLSNLADISGVMWY